MSRNYHVSIADDVRGVLQASDITGLALTLPTGQLDRALYTRVDKVLRAAGGKWNRAQKAHVFATDPREVLGLALETGAIEDVKKARQQFFTPHGLAQQLCAQADVQPGHLVLEPSAGAGAIARVARFSRGAAVECIEIDPVLARQLIADGFHVTQADFLTLQIAPVYDRVVMNPPFTGGQDIAHVTKAFSLLKPGGRLVSVMAAGITFSAQARARDFRTLVNAHGGGFEDVADDAFRESGTGVRTVIVTITKAAQQSARDRAARPGRDTNPPEPKGRTETMSPMQITEIPIGDLRENPNNPRRHIDARKLAELAASIKEKGIRQPLEVRALNAKKPYDFEIVYGNRRFKAAQLAGLEMVPCIVKVLSDEEAFDIAVTENLQRDDMTPLDEARAYHALLNRGAAAAATTIAEIAARFGKAESYIYRRHKLLDLVPEIQAALDEGRITIGHAERLARMSPELQREAFDVDTGCVFDCRPLLVAGDNEDDSNLGLDNLRPVHELDAFIRRHVAIRPDDAALKHFQPELAEAIDAAAVDVMNARPLAPGEFQDEEDLETAKASLLELSDDTFVKKTLSHLEGQPLPLGKNRWREITAKKDRCDHVQRGVVTHGGPYRVLEVCAKKGCPTHFPVTKREPSGRQSLPKPAGKSQWEIDDDRRKAERKAWQALFPDVAPALVAHLMKVKFDAALVKHVIHATTGYSEFADVTTVKKLYGVTLSNANAALVLALATINTEDRQDFMECVKPFKFNLGKVEQKLQAEEKKGRANVDRAVKAVRTAKKKGKAA